MKGKTKFLLLVMALLLCLLPGAQAETDECQHNWVYIHHADCNSGGEYTRECTICYASEDIYWEDALGHDWKWSTRTEATCTEGGSEYGECSRCGATEMRDVKALGHAWDNGTITTAATCTTDGMMTFTCSRCRTTKTETIPATGQHIPVSIPAVAASCTAGGKTEGSQCSVCGTVLTAQQDTAALGHSWDSGTVTTAATCTADGVKTYTCTRCGTTKTESIPATGHTPVSIPGKAATCTEPGLTDGSQCSVCGTVLTAQQPIPATGHTAVTVPGKAATCTESGLTDGSQCSVCGTILTAQQTIPATGHTAVLIPGRVATCTVPGLTEGSQCSVCGTVLTAQQEIAATGHAWDGGTVTKEAGNLNPGETIYTCTRCGVTRTEEIPTSTFSINMMRNYPPIPEGTMGLRIVQQPEGGILTEGGTVQLTIEVEGGVGEYTYEWHCETDSPLQARDTLFQQADTFAETVIGSYNTKKSGFAGDFAKLVQSGSTASTSNSSAAYTFGGAIYEASQEPRSYDLNDHTVTTITSIEPTLTYDAIASGSYYCVVRDEAGNFVCSEDAVVTTGLYIAVQPKHTNIYGFDTINLTCVAGGGSGPENQSYTWYDSDGTVVSDQSVFPAMATGEYHCLVVDFKTDETIESKTVQVYSEEIDIRPIITLQPRCVTMEYREDGQYGWQMACEATTFDGASEDLEYEWQRQGKLFGLGVWWPLDKEDTLRSNSESGTYRCKITDTRTGAYIYTITATVDVGCACAITGIETSTGFSCTLGYTIMGGSSPYTVKLYQHRFMEYDYDEGKPIYKTVLISENTIQEPGHFRTTSVEYTYSLVYQFSKNAEPQLNYFHPDYYIVVEDANGNKCKSELFTP